MNKYKLGIMSSTWEIEAPNVDVATCALYLHTQSGAPIACYLPEGEKSKFSVMLGDDKKKMREFQLFMDENQKEIREAYKTIVKKT